MDFFSIFWIFLVGENESIIVTKVYVPKRNVFFYVTIAIHLYSLFVDTELV